MSFVADLRVVLEGRDFRRLFGTRLVSQFSDGIFQFGVAGFAFFSPENQTTRPGASPPGWPSCCCRTRILGPFVGVFIDRWSRRQILMVAPLVRGALLLVAAALVAADVPDPFFYAAALGVLGVNRFFLAALGASLPHVVPAGPADGRQRGHAHLRHRAHLRRRGLRLPAAELFGSGDPAYGGAAGRLRPRLRAQRADRQDHGQRRCSARPTTRTGRRPARPYATC